MLKITFGKTRYNADKLLLNIENNTLELGNGYKMTNLSAHADLSEFVQYVNKQYLLGDNIINADIWYSRNGGSETEPNYIVEKMENQVTPIEDRFHRNVFIDGQDVQHYGYKILQIVDNMILLTTPRSIITIQASDSIIMQAKALETILTTEPVITLDTIAFYLNQEMKTKELTVTSTTFNRN
ncbi:hypothetical protein KZO01_20160 [Kurthia zopfii]|uniref:Uncharacterized protein n=1 Tax=Kurthia zopfii TaxID=1650 RepID=A0A8B4QAI6_9BACL|nr:hypothetical protein [Kurthia zopfii]PWI22998.1 hypothetical protein DF281_04960 [Kurthia zopfii]TDR40897.1 hypothetical protein DFR61_10712 [Kurthia zopfii]GEK31707.1 hypothetical protein KZO01_20160 [Kurthia zopfii]STX09729.1 Uncharacterised protein [Kurthia zopfii]